MAANASTGAAARVLTRQEVFDAAAPFVAKTVDRFVARNASRYPQLSGLREDMIQEGLVELWSASEGYDSDRADLETFTRSVTRNAVASYLRGHRGESGLTGRQVAARGGVAPRRFSYNSLRDDLAKDHINIALVGSDPEHTDGPAAELLAAIRRTRAGLTPAEEQAVASYFADGLLMREAAERQGVSESRICQLVHNALARIRRSMLDSGRTCLN